MNAERNDAETQDAKKHFWKDYAPIEKMTFVLATFTVVYSLITLGLLFIAMRQVDSMRKDQRPWVVEAIQIQQIPDKSTSIPIVTNTMNPGKTPAKSVFSEVFVERVKNGEEPRLSSTIPISTLSMGIMYPAGVQTWSVQYDLLGSEVEDYKAGRLFLVIYGNITYMDVFKTSHWTKFCVFNAGGAGNFSARKCTDYNNADND